MSFFIYNADKTSELTDGVLAGWNEEEEEYSEKTNTLNFTFRLDQYNFGCGTFDGVTSFNGTSKSQINLSYEFSFNEGDTWETWLNSSNNTPITIALDYGEEYDHATKTCEYSFVKYNNTLTMKETIVALSDDFNTNYGVSYSIGDTTYINTFIAYYVQQEVVPGEYETTGEAVNLSDTLVSGETYYSWN